MAAINTNSLSLVAQAHRSQAQTSLSAALERLASGLRINGAKDDAAGLAISNRMEANLRAGNQVARGINDGISLLQTAEGGLDSINGLLQRSRQLAVQAANGALSDHDRQAVHAEFLELRAEIDRIAMDTEAFGKHLLAPTERPEPLTQLGSIRNIKEIITPDDGWLSFFSGIAPFSYIPQGATNVTIEMNSYGWDDDLQLFTRDGAHLVGTPVIGNSETGSAPDEVWQDKNINDGGDVADAIFTQTNGFPADAEYDASDLLGNDTNYDPAGGITGTYNGMSFTYSGDGDRHDDSYNDGYTASGKMIERVFIDKTSEPLFVSVIGSGSFQLRVGWQHMPDTVEPPPPPMPLSSETRILTSANYGDEAEYISIPPAPADSTTLGLEDVALDTQNQAGKAIQAIDEALARIDGYRSEYGALHNRFESAIDNLSQTQVNTAAAQSRILDADYAEEAANMTRAKILQQAGASILAQANQVPQSVLSLLG